ncbi:MAG: tRNA (adenosine(37)-N6)-threonylcarbamoyltransferase complex ATPase subunit type 1 TsaE [Endomicrobiaceae bacterium]|nr:tRNA (adenosine(37)-N6)-threonylcarbamoyltransferase complex ATPase subunit type 1 TsaE [Endomicrobiaceae bacterium]
MATNTFENKTFLTGSAMKTKKLGKDFASDLKAGDIVFFNGDLGAGKTTFIQGIMSKFGIKRFVRSASFMLVNEFETENINLYHIDLYRLGKTNIYDLGLDEYLFGKGISLIEWSERLTGCKNQKRWEINIEYVDENTRDINIKRVK